MTQTSAATHEAHVIQRGFTGRHMALLLIGFFGVVIAVNLIMATLAVRGFGGTVVDNSYVASQNYNRWLAEGRAQAALGWRVETVRDAAGHVRLTVSDNGAPWAGRVTATVQRSGGRGDASAIMFAGQGSGQYRSVTAVAPGRATLRLRLQHADSRTMQMLVRLP